MHRLSSFCPGLAALCALACTVSGFASAQAYPTRPVRFIVPFEAGGNTDIFARVIAQALSGRLGHQVIVDNRGGAGGTIGTAIAARADPDGYTLLMVSASHVINPSVQKKLPYDSLKDFTPITLIADVPSLLVAHPSLPVKNVPELIALAKSKPGQLNYGSSGNGTAAHLGFELLKSMTGLKVEHVPYKGNAPAAIGLLSGQVQLMMGAQPAAMPHVKSGKVRALGVTSAKRSTALPDVPAIGETVPGYEFNQGFGILAPAGTPQPIIVRLNREINEILRTREVRDILESQGAVPAGNTPAEYAAYLKKETAKMARIVKDSGARVD